MSSEPLLPWVAVVRLSGEVPEQLNDIVTKAVERALEVQLAKITMAHPAAVKAKGAAAYLGISRSHFYALLDSDSDLTRLAFTLGRSRLWLITDLDNWVRAKQCVGKKDTT
jgi:hypothetical protein